VDPQLHRKQEAGSRGEPTIRDVIHFSASADARGEERADGPGQETDGSGASCTALVGGRRRPIRNLAWQVPGPGRLYFAALEMLAGERTAGPSRTQDVAH
jgi:hypothetical protein